MLAVALHLLFNSKKDCHCSVLRFEQVAETTPSETTEMLAASSPEAARIDSEVTQFAAESVNSISEADTETPRTGEEVLAEGLIPSDANGSLDDTLASQPTAAEDPAAVSTSQTSDDAQVDPNSTAALIQVSRSSQLSLVDTTTASGISGASMHCSLCLHQQLSSHMSCCWFSSFPRWICAVQACCRSAIAQCH